MGQSTWGSIRTWKLNEQQTPIMNTKSLILIFSLMLLSIGAMPQEAPPGAEEVAKAEEEAPLEADVAGEAVETERQGDIGEAPPGAEDLADEAELDEDEEEDPDMTDEEIAERDGDEEDEELDEDEPEEDEAEEEDATEDKEEEDIPEELAAAIKAEEDKMKEASDKSEEPIAPVSEVKAEV